MSMATTTDIVRTSIKTIYTPEQKEFHRLKKKVEWLQNEQKNRQEQLDHCLLFYHEKIKPEEEIVYNAMMERVRLIYAFYKKQGCFSKAERRTLKHVILNSMDQVFEMVEFGKISPEIKQIFKELNGCDFGDVAAEELELTKSQLKEMFKEEGVDVDFSGINCTESLEEILRKMSESVDAALFEKSDQPQEELKEKPKTKKQLQKEQRRREAEELQKRSLNTIYKQLAKTFHPDLEPDVEQKARKEVFMKKLTNAYENNDLYTLLTLENEWMNISSSQAASQSREQLKIYNAILRDQVRALQDSLGLLITHPKYFQIHKFFEYSYGGMQVLQRVYDAVRKDARDLQIMIGQLRAPRAEMVLKAQIGSYKKMQSEATYYQ
jgi:hypothetical protein